MRWALMLVCLLVVMSALVQISLVHQHRQLVQQWQQLETLRNELQQQQTRLQLEASTLTNYARIDRQARAELQMTEPEDIRVVTP